MLERMLTVAVFLFFFWPAQAATIFVPDNQPTLQDAINAAVDGDTVIVRPGTYLETVNFGPSGVPKAIKVKSERGPAVTTIDGGQSDHVVSFISGEGLNSVLEGFTVTNGKSGIYCRSSSPSIIKNIITGNKTFFDGGGIVCIYSNANIVGNIISGNEAYYSGGGIDCHSASPSIVHNFISANRAFEYGGGGIYCYASASPIIFDNIITGNVADDYGGGVYCRDGSSPGIINNIIARNKASYIGGGICCREGSSPSITNNKVSENFSDSFGGGIACRDTSSPRISNTTIYRNRASTRGGGIYTYKGSTSLTNTICYDNSSPSGSEIYVESGDPPVSYCNVKGGWPGLGNIDADPLFANPLYGDFHITWNSPCRNSGNDSYVTMLTDFEGDPRIHDGRVDMGADEFYPHLYSFGDVVPGGSFSLRIIGTPSTPAILALGSGVQDPPSSTLYGDLYLQLPLLQTIFLGPIPPEGLRHLTVSVPSSWIPGEEKPMQALCGLLGSPGSVLTNLLVLTVQ